jgi:hypothetical protein
VIALLLTFLTFLYFWLIGLGVLAAVRADTSSLRIALTAPALGTATTVLPLFLFSLAGASMNDVARPVVLVLCVGAVAALAVRRPTVHRAVAPMIGLCAVGLLLLGRPMVDYGFDWIANANDDMANYVLAATKLMESGLLGPLDVEGMSEGRNYASHVQLLHTAGARPGSDITLAGFSATVGRAPYELFMPLILALNLVALCGTGALALQASRRWWAALVAGGLLLVSPLAAYGIVQQLLPQVWGLGLAAALLALLMREELHRAPGAAVRDIVPIGLLTAATALVYVELASTLVVAYAVYVAVLAARRRIQPRTVALRLWAPVLLILVVALNAYLLREVQFVSGQASTGIGGSGDVPIFGFALVPAALPAIVGLEPFSGAASSSQILIAALLLAVVVIAAVISASRGTAAAIVLTTYAALALVLGVSTADFGLFKLYMYAQPFLAAAVAVWLSSNTRKPILWAAALVVALLVPQQLGNQQDYVAMSRNPVDLRNASEADLLPAFRGVVAGSPRPVVSVTEHPTLAKIEAAGMGDRPLHFLSFDLLGRLASDDRELQRQILELRERDAWRQRTFDLHVPRSARRVNRFAENTRASQLLSTGQCEIVFPSGSVLPLNRRAFPDGSPSLVGRSCNDPRNILAFTTSARGTGFYLFSGPNTVSFYQLEPDPYVTGSTFAGAGRFVLLRVLGPSARMRVAVDLTSSFGPDAGRALPPAAAVGATREPLTAVGRGSARLFSPVLRPQLIGGHPYVLVDMGVDGRLSNARRSGLSGLYSGSVPVDARHLTSRLRDISLISEAEYRQLDAPSAVQRFPEDLANPDLEYSGIYEDGWVGEESRVVLAAGGPTTLVVRAEVPPAASQRLRVTVDGKRVHSGAVKPGSLVVRVPLPASRERRRIALQWAEAPQLGGLDTRLAAARLEFVGLVPPSRG